MEDTRKRTIITVATLLAIVLIVGGAAAFAKHNGKTGMQNTADMAQTNTTSDSSTTETPAANTTNNTTYKDGTYTATGSYQSPAGEQSIDVSVTLQNGVVTDSNVTSKATDDEAHDYQEAFISGYKQYVSGKKIDSISISRVSGSSLTSTGFNNALKQIESQAKSS